MVITTLSYLLPISNRLTLTFSSTADLVVVVSDSTRVSFPSILFPCIVLRVHTPTIAGAVRWKEGMVGKAAILLSTRKGPRGEPPFTAPQQRKGRGGI